MCKLAKEKKKGITRETYMQQVTITFHDVTTSYYPVGSSSYIRGSKMHIAANESEILHIDMKQLAFCFEK